MTRLYACETKAFKTQILLDSAVSAGLVWLLTTKY